MTINTRYKAKPYRTTTPRNGKPRGRPTLLYVRYRDMRSRCKGTGATKNPEIYTGLECEFTSFEQFRAFALSRGFSKVHNSPDRIDTTKGYVRTNIRFVEPLTNAVAALRQNVTGVIDFDDVPF